MTTETNTQPIIRKISPLQAEFLARQEKELLFSGAFGASKTRSGCFKLIEHAQIPGNMVGVFRKTLTALKPTTLYTLLKEPIPGPVLEPGSYHHNKTDHIIELYGGGTIIYGGFEDEEKIKSLNLGAAFIDEATELDEHEYMVLLGRLRNPADPNPQLISATNPAPPSHFLYERFIAEKAPDRAVLYGTPDDNPFLPEGYRQTLAGFTGQYRERYVKGLWVAFEGLVYSMWDRKHFVVERKGPWKEIVVGVDEGFDHPFVALKAGIDIDGRPHIMYEISESGLLQETKIAKLKALKADVYVVPPEAAGLIAAMRDKGLHVLAADNAVLDGITRAQNRLTVDETGSPRMTISPGCTKTIRGVESYHWKDKSVKDEPVKQMDDEVDALRYLIAYLDGGGQPSLYVFSREAEPSREQKREEGQKQEAHLATMLESEDGGIWKEL